jgi:hypothetical protein
MKKVIAVFLAVITFVASSHVTVAFHYCGGEFHSVALVSATVENCCEGEDLEHRSPCNGAEFQSEKCCSNHIQQISTDDFQITKQDISFKSNSAIFLPVVILFQGFQDLQKLFLIFERVFSPPDLNGGISRIISLCVFRI